MGSFTCSCYAGYNLESGQYCTGKIFMNNYYAWVILYTHTDINECAINNGGCEQNCENDVGDYNCTCFNGYTLDDNGYDCTGKIIICYWGYNYFYY